MFFWKSHFLFDPADVGNLIFGSSAVSKSSLYIWKFSVHILWSLAWRILNITLLVCETSALYSNLDILCHYFSLGMKWKLTFSSPVATAEVKRSEVAQSCPTLSGPVDCSLPGSSLHGIFQARILEWVAISFSRGSSQPRDRTEVSLIVGRRFTV